MTCRSTGNGPADLSTRTAGMTSCGERGYVRCRRAPRYSTSYFYIHFISCSSRLSMYSCVLVLGPYPAALVPSFIPSSTLTLSFIAPVSIVDATMEKTAAKVDGEAALGLGEQRSRGDSLLVAFWLVGDVLVVLRRRMRGASRRRRRWKGNVGRWTTKLFWTVSVLSGEGWRR
jgi:hypothetical protein